MTGFVLMGPPGAGKSFIAKALRDSGVARYTELEPRLIREFGEYEEFVANKEGALRFIQNHLEAELADPTPVLFESTGISDRAMLVDLGKRYPLVLIKVKTPKSICMERIGRRSPGRNITNDLWNNDRVYEHWCAEVEHSYGFDLEVDGSDAESAVNEISALISQRS